MSLLDANYERYIQLALQEAEKGRGRTSPNPLVGAVVVKDKQVISSGYHAQAGRAHAEIRAMEAARQAGHDLRGATLVVTLEPCSHIGKTGPCVEAIIEAGISKVVAGTKDPNPLVAGNGFRRLSQAGVKVLCGVKETECRKLNEAFFVFITQGRPFVTWKVALSLDGRIATRSGHAKWVSGPASRLVSHRLRDEVDAIAVGIGTVLSDDPQLTTRLPDRERLNPRRIVLDSQLRIPLKARLLQGSSPRGPGIIACLANASKDKELALKDLGVEVLRLPDRDGHVAIPELLKALGERQITHLLLEGGSKVAGAFFDAQLIDRVTAFIAPKLVGGNEAVSSLGGLGVKTMGQAAQLIDVQTSWLPADQQEGADLCYTARLAYRSTCRTLCTY